MPGRAVVIAALGEGGEVGAGLGGMGCVELEGDCALWEDGGVMVSYVRRPQEVLHEKGKFTIDVSNATSFAILSRFESQYLFGGCKLKMLTSELLAGRNLAQGTRLKLGKLRPCPMTLQREDLPGQMNTRLRLPFTPSSCLLGFVP